MQAKRSLFPFWLAQKEIEKRNAVQKKRATGVKLPE
jgi:hypothetical protein